MRVVPVPCREDNYSYLLIDESTKTATAVDPFDLEAIQAAASNEDVKITANITTHYHFDHAGGNDLFAKAYPEAPIYGGSKRVLNVTKTVEDKEELDFGEDIHIKCYATPCHTKDSICYFVTDKKKPDEKVVFTGDTLFQGGCGRFFEGTAEDMHKALTYLCELPDDTKIYNGHEYTFGNHAFAKTVDPEGDGTKALGELVKNNKQATGQSTIAQEKTWNVFMRLDTDPVRNATGEKDTIPVMTKLRQMKNSFRP